MKSNLIVFLAMLIVGLVLYGQTFDDPFHFDDYHVFADRTLDELVEKCRHPNRLVPHLTFLLNFGLHGTEVEGYHALNIWIHVFTAFFVFLLIDQCGNFLSSSKRKNPAVDETDTTGPVEHQRSMSPDETGPRITPGAVSVVGGFAFLTHPLATQSVSYICQRYTSLATLFYVAAIVVYLVARQVDMLTGKQGSCRSLLYVCVSSLLATLAMLSKELAVSLPAIVLLLEFVVVDRSRNGLLRRLLYMSPVLATGLIIPWIHLDFTGILSTMQGVDGGFGGVGIVDPLITWAPQEITRSAYFLTQLVVIATVYLKLALIPVGQSVDHLFTIVYTARNQDAVSAAMVLLSVAGAGVLSIRRFPLVAVGIFWFFVTVAPTSSIIPNTEFVAEHRAYLPLVGFAMVVAGAFQSLRLTTRSSYLLFGIYIFCLGTLTIRRNHVWNGADALWQDAIDRNPTKARPHFALGTIFEQRGEFINAGDAYSAAIRNFPKYAFAWNNLGNVHQYRSDFDAALFCYMQAARLFPNYPEAYYNLGLVHNKRNELEAALRASRRAVELRWPYPEAHYNLAQVYEKMGRLEAARESYGAAIELAPAYFPAHFYLGGLLRTMGRIEESVESYENCIRLRPNFISAYIELAALHTQSGRYSQAIELLRAVSDHESTVEAKIHYQIAKNLQLMNELEGAIAEYEKAVLAGPQSGEYHYRLAHTYFLIGAYDRSVESLRTAMKLGYSINAEIASTLGQAGTEADGDELRKAFEPDDQVERK